MQNKRKYLWIIIIGIMFIFLLKENLKFVDDNIDYNELVEQNISFEGFKLGMTIGEFKELHDIENGRFRVMYCEGYIIYDNEKMIEYNFDTTNDYAVLYSITTHNPLHEVFGFSVGDSTNDARLKLNELGSYEPNQSSFYFIGDYAISINECYGSIGGVSSPSNSIIECFNVRLSIGNLEE